MATVKKYASFVGTVAISRYIAIIHTITFLQIFKTGHFFTKKHCRDLQWNHKSWPYFV